MEDAIMNSNKANEDVILYRVFVDIVLSCMKEQRQAVVNIAITVVLERNE